MNIVANKSNCIANVYLNSHKMKRVLIADDLVGYIVIAEVDGAGRLKVSGGEIVRKKLLGKVRIEVIHDR